jgi:hypothetical protein
VNGLPLYAQLLLGVVGPAVGAAIALFGVWLNTRTTTASAAAERATEHSNRLREEIAVILAERPYMLRTQTHLFTTAHLHYALKFDNRGPDEAELFAARGITTLCDPSN